MFMFSIFWKCSLVFLVIIISVCSAKISCLKCNSSINPNCSSRPEKISFTEFCEHRCAILIDDSGSTVRKCLSDTEKCIKPNCKECYDDKCNFEIFPAARLKCHQCSGSNCFNLNSSHLELPCKKFVDNDSCFTYVIDKNNAVRGCTSDENRECIKAADLCKICDSPDGCNNEPGTYTVNCFQCISHSNKECQKILSPNSKYEIDNELSSCSYQELLGRQGNYNTAISTNNVMRPCKLLKINPDNKEVLYNCTGYLSNKDLKCIQYNKNVIHIGYDQASGLESFNKIGQEYNLTCDRCENAGGKNTFPGRYVKKRPILCYKCDSRTNSLCSGLSASTSKAGLIHACNFDDEYCMAVLTEEGYTIRDCLSKIQNIECSETDPNCKKCNEHLCNIGVMPPNRIGCYQCDGAKDKECNNKPYSSYKVCRRYIPNDNCYTFARSDKNMVRGCQSDLDTNSEQCEKHKATTCTKCNSSRCNSLPYLGSSNLLCYKCDADNVECAWSYEGYDYCQKNVTYWEQEEESCFIYKHKDGSVTRGCTSDSDLCSNEDDQNCMKFKGDYSNNKTTVVQSCYVCDSNITGEENCADNPEKIKPIACTNENVSYRNRGCYKRIADGQVTRGCRDNSNKYGMEVCGKFDFCYTCLPDNCNKSSSKEVSLLAICIILFNWIFS